MLFRLFTLTYLVNIVRATVQSLHILCANSLMIFIPTYIIPIYMYIIINLPISQLCVMLDYLTCICLYIFSTVLLLLFVIISIELYLCYYLYLHILYCIVFMLLPFSHINK